MFGLRARTIVKSAAARLTDRALRDYGPQPRRESLTAI
jgi:hypothetical protein